MPPGRNVFLSPSHGIRKNRRDVIQDWKDKCREKSLELTLAPATMVFNNDYELLKKTFMQKAATGRPENLCQLMTAICTSDSPQRAMLVYRLLRGNSGQNRENLPSILAVTGATTLDIYLLKRGSCSNA